MVHLLIAWWFSMAMLVITRCYQTQFWSRQAKSWIPDLERIKNADLEIHSFCGNHRIAVREDLQDITFFLPPNNNFVGVCRHFFLNSIETLEDIFKQIINFTSNLVSHSIIIKILLPHGKRLHRAGKPMVSIGKSSATSWCSYVNVYRVTFESSAALRPSVVPCWSAQCWWRCQWRHLADRNHGCMALLDILDQYLIVYIYIYMHTPSGK